MSPPYPPFARECSLQYWSNFRRAALAEVGAKSKLSLYSNLEVRLDFHRAAGEVVAFQKLLWKDTSQDKAGISIIYARLSIRI